ncbi:CBN-ACS-14 protein [Aphelenchoides avenae]|nr:CBN-ACS-14 protein [Aphelenchus avenae]
MLTREPLLFAPHARANVDDDVCFLPYSSGRGGYPKGVMLTHRNWGTMVNIFSSYWNDVMSTVATSWRWKDENALQAMPFFHDYGFCMLCTGLMLGTTGVCMAKFDPDLYCRTIQDYKIRLLFVAPSTITFLAKSPILAKYDLSSVQFVCSAGTPVSKELCEAAAKRLASRPHVVQAYGMAEVSMSSHLYIPNKLYGPRYGSSGRLSATFEAKIVEPRTGLELPPGKTGELWLRGPCVMRGYLNNRSATLETITEDRWYKTGDTCYMDADGFLCVVQQARAVLRVKSYQVRNKGGARPA